PGSASQVEISSTNAGEERNLRYSRSSIKKRIIRIARNDQAELALLLCSPPVFVRGIRRGRAVWERELDCGSLWHLLNENGEFIRKGRSTGSARGSATRSSVSGLSYVDVREARDRAFQSPLPANNGSRVWQEWLAKHQPQLLMDLAPSWCLDLAPRLRKVSRA